MKTEDFKYDLPEGLIAQTPLKNRDTSRLLVLDKKNGEIEHKVFNDILEYLNEGDALVLNETKVLPARIFGKSKDTDGSMELLLLERIEGEEDVWEVLAKPAKRAKKGRTYIFGDGLLQGEIIAEHDEGIRHIKLAYDGVLEEVLDEIGTMPLPPYISEALEEQDRYQTVYAKNSGSAAAPTAGLHFTEELLSKIIDKGVKIIKITLHVGLGTFRPVKVENVKEHVMHSEYYHVSKDAADAINEVKSSGGKVICTGTTSVRTLETVTDEKGVVHPGSGHTDIFIYPGYNFKIADMLITNFHLPESTLIMLVSALAGRGNVMEAYRQAVEREYRFFSFGDAMLIK
ncbi:MAG: tRNA preQ1(34) S-adenosylmethionine ribosyltransferase-isomerase QueA [Clostridia bacterium]|nr:tRNA preQ1(34) S-adenosylmethionine ribosyltransferase-isomerase QueA [Clostridia bacterium]